MHVGYSFSAGIRAKLMVIIRGVMVGVMRTAGAVSVVMITIAIMRSSLFGLRRGGQSTFGGRLLRVW